MTKDQKGRIWDNRDTKTHTLGAKFAELNFVKDDVRTGLVPAAIADERAVWATSPEKRLLFLLGPAFVASIAYVDPGNVAAHLTAGAQYGYLLVWVLVAANAMAVLFQYLSAKLGLVVGKSLPELLGDRLPRGGRLAYWAQAEIIAAATDLAEVIGGAISWPTVMRQLSTTRAAQAVRAAARPVLVSRLGIDEHRFRTVRWYRDEDQKWRRIEPWMTTFTDLAMGASSALSTGATAPLSSPGSRPNHAGGANEYESWRSTRRCRSGPPCAPGCRRRECRSIISTS